MTNELVYLDMINRINTQQSLLQNAAATLITLTAPVPNNFFNPVTVTASQAQINASLEPYQTSNSNCAVCQEAISSGGCRIRQCGHVYHRTCIETWLSMSVRCPVCRHDIREVSPAVQTSSVSEQTSSQQEDQ